MACQSLGVPVRLYILGELLAVADSRQILLEHGSEDRVVIVRHVVVVRDQFSFIGVLAYRSSERVADRELDVRERRYKSAVVDHERLTFLAVDEPVEEVLCLLALLIRSIG